ncbi:leucine-rich repeat domain-containing protein [Nostoc sp.]|uniref:leucine-rich repeat domain-containing protein n=1 Tax=Nostoc sp. TaxID=1180 RepID=UPI003FA555F9
MVIPFDEYGTAIERQAGYTELSLHGIGLTELPESIGTLTQLRVLDLYQNRLTTLPETIASLTGLQKLSLRANEFTELPEAITALTGLQSLNLSISLFIFRLSFCLF